MLEAVRAIPEPVPSREDMVAMLIKEQGFTPALAHWLGSNLITEPDGGLHWSFNIDGAGDVLETVSK